jgi:hypothetical protein
MAWFRSWRRGNDDLAHHIRKYKRFDGLALTTTDHIVYHGDSRGYALIEAAGGLKRYISNPLSPKPALMNGGGTTNTVTTTLYPNVAASYAARGGSSHTVKANTRFIYAVYLPAGSAIDLVRQLPSGAGPYQMTDNNARTAEFLTLDVDLGQILGYMEIEKSATNGKVKVINDYVHKADLKQNTTSFEERTTFMIFKCASDFDVQPV